MDWAIRTLVGTRWSLIASNDGGEVVNRAEVDAEVTRVGRVGEPLPSGRTLTSDAPLEWVGEVDAIEAEESDPLLARPLRSSVSGGALAGWCREGLLASPVWSRKSGGAVTG
jgi:hypothetical protein